jgi:chromatin segregation and condensation protein Rec8/ScpA/Scc1 (kleisin family)
MSKKPHKHDKFYLNLPYLALIDKDIWKNKNPWSFDISKILPEFYTKMNQEIDELGGLYFKLLGKALLTASELHKKKIEWLFKTEKEEEEKRKIERKKLETKDFPALKTPIRRHTEHFDKEDLMYELVDVLIKERKRMERYIKKRNKEKSKRAKRGSARVRLTDVMKAEDFDYEIDKDRMDAQKRNKQVLETALKLIQNSENGEIRFEKLLSELSGLSGDPRILIARILLSILFLMMDGLLNAEQEVDTKRIWILAPK